MGIPHQAFDHEQFNPDTLLINARQSTLLFTVESHIRLGSIGVIHLLD